VIRTLLAPLAGYAAMVVLVMSSLAVLAWTAFGGFPSPAGQPYQGPVWFLVAELAVSLAAAAVGGWVAAFVGTGAPLRHGMHLGLLVLVLGLVSAAVEAGMKPLWSSLALPAVGVAGVMAGAWLRSRGIPI